MCNACRGARPRRLSANRLATLPIERAAAERLLTVIGEAAKNVSPGFREEHPEIPWRGVAGLRDRLVHYYFGVDYEAVWATISEELPVLEMQVRAVVESRGI